MTEIEAFDPNGYERGGFAAQPVEVRPYDNTAIGFLTDGAILELDDPGIHVIQDVARWRGPDGEFHFHPVFTAQHALAAISGFARTGRPEYLTRAVANAKHLVDNAIADGDALWFPYGFPHRYYDVTMPTPWWSGMAQGQALSVFSRLAEMQSDVDHWRVFADRVFQSYFGWRRLGAPWMSMVDRQGWLWFEEYAGDVEPLKVMNGHIFAIFGLYDYIAISASDDASDLFDGACATVLHYADSIRVPGGISYYCSREGYCQRPEWQNASYHPLHVRQFEYLHAMTGDQRFLEVAKNLASDYCE